VVVYLCIGSLEPSSFTKCEAQMGLPPCPRSLIFGMPHRGALSPHLDFKRALSGSFLAIYEETC